MNFFKIVAQLLALTTLIRLKHIYAKRRFNTGSHVQTVQEQAKQFFPFMPSGFMISRSNDANDGEECFTAWSRTDNIVDCQLNVYIYRSQASCAAYANCSEHKFAFSNELSKRERDCTVRVPICGLQASSTYYYKIWFTQRNQSTPTAWLPYTVAGHMGAGRFRTPSSNNSSHAVTIAFGGDIAGQNVCQDKQSGIPILQMLARLTNLDAFVGLGDMIYADNECNEWGKYGNAQIPLRYQNSSHRSVEAEDFWRSWRYLYADKSWQRFLSSVTYYSTYDDHEIYDNFVNADDETVRNGKKAMLDYKATIVNDSSISQKLYTSARYGKHLELIVLDTRSFREPVGNSSGCHTMLGKKQKQWLKALLRNTDATWKVIASSVPLSFPIGNWQTHTPDGWADGSSISNGSSSEAYECELVEIVDWLAQLPAKQQNVVFVTSDVHYAAVLKYPLPTKNELALPTYFYEIITSPMNAGIFPRSKSATFDETLLPQLLFEWIPENCGSTNVNDTCRGAPNLTWRGAVKYFNVAIITTQASSDLSKVNLRVRLVTAESRVIYDELLVPAL